MLFQRSMSLSFRVGGEVAIPYIKGALDLVKHLCQPTRTQFFFFQLCKQVLSHGWLWNELSVVSCQSCHLYMHCVDTYPQKAITGGRGLAVAGIPMALHHYMSDSSQCSVKDLCHWPFRVGGKGLGFEEGGSRWLFVITCQILPHVLSKIHAITNSGAGECFFGGVVPVVALGVRVSYHVPMMILMLLLLLLLLLLMMMMMMINVEDRVATPGKQWRLTAIIVSIVDVICKYSRCYLVVGQEQLVRG